MAAYYVLFQIGKGKRHRVRGATVYCNELSFTKWSEIRSTDLDEISADAKRKDAELRKPGWVVCDVIKLDDASKSTARYGGGNGD